MNDTPSTQRKPAENPKDTFSWQAALLLLAIVATAVVIPMFFLDNASGHDFQFHLGSWMDAAGQWKEGVLYPRWAEWANWGFGEPRFLFYPPASWMFGAALGTVLPWRVAPGAFIWLALVAAGMSMWKLAREWLPGRQAAAAAVLFAVNPYHLVIVYYRSDFAELLAAVFWPLLLWAALHAMRGEWRWAPALAIFFCAIWLSNAPAAVIATYSLILLMAVACAMRRSVQPGMIISAGMAGGFGLASFYILPAAWEQRWVQIAQVVTENLHPVQNFLFTRSINPEFELFNWKVSGVAMEVMLVTGLGAVFSARRRKEYAEVWWPLLALGAASALMMFRPSEALWDNLPKLRFVQFPWRWLEPLNLVLAFFVAAGIGSLRRSAARKLAALLLIAALAGTATLLILDGWWDSGDVPFLLHSIHADRGYEGTNEYQPVGSDRSNLPGYTDDADDNPELPSTPRIEGFDSATGKLVPVEGIRVHAWTAEQKIFTSQASGPETLAIRLVEYPAWTLFIDSKPAQPGTVPDSGEMLVPLPAGAHHVELDFRRTPDRTIGAAISGFSAIAILVFVWARPWFGRSRQKFV